MSRIHRHIASLLFLGIALSATAQEPLGLHLSNPAFLDLCQGRWGQVSLDLSKENGGLMSLSQSPDSYRAGADARAYCRISPQLTFFGKMDWTYFYGKEMGGQILMDPSYDPVNFLESTEETRGAKHRERYSLEGGLSCKLGDRWAAGFKIDYESADQAKIKDPRFSNIWMDIDVHAGISCKPGDRWMFGLSLEYRNTLEQLKGGVYGTTDKQYFVATDKGNYLGTVSELAGDYNAIPVSSLRPLSNQFFGGSVQTVLDDRFASELCFQLRSGYYGRKSSTTATFYEWDGIRAGYKAWLLVPAAGGLHRVDLKIDFESLTNRENKYRYITPDGQNTIVDYLGQDVILRRIQASAQAGYSWNDVLGIRLDGRFQSQTAELFPYTRRQQVVSLGADLFGRKDFPVGKSRLTAELHALFGGGFGTPKEDEMTPGVASTLKSFDNYLYRQYEYETALRAGATAALTWALPARGKMAPYVRLSDQYLHLLAAPEYLEGAGRNVAAVCIGCHF
jgi:hypothetical protein